MYRRFHASWWAALIALAAATTAAADDPPHPLLTWVKRHPLSDAATPSPRLGYETSYGYDPASRLLIRYGGHNQGGGGEQNSEVWTYDLDRDQWRHHLPNDAPPGVCCAQQNAFHDALGRLVRFPAFSGSHGWQSWREIFLKDSSAWTYELAANRWLDMRPLPAPPVRPLRGSAYDPRHEAIVIHGGEGAGHGTLAYDLYTNTWHWLEPPDPKPPTNISQPGFTYDAVNEAFVLFGSQFGADPRTWVYDLRANRWRVLPVAEHPPAEQTSPVLAADTRNGIVLCSLKGAQGHETWVLDVATAQWRRLALPEEPLDARSRNRVLLYLPDRNLFVLENRSQDIEPKEQQIWTFRYAEAPPPSPAPTELQATAAGPDRLVLTWQPPAGHADAQYTVERGEGDAAWRAAWEPIAEGLPNSTFTDNQVRPHGSYFYRVRAVAADGRPLGVSALARSRPPIVERLVVSALAPRRVALAWEPLPREDIVGYHVERADAAVYAAAQIPRIRQRYGPLSDAVAGKVKAIGPFTRLTTAPVPTAQFVDETVDLAAGQRDVAEPIYDGRLRDDQLDADAPPYRFAVYAYRVVAVSRLGAESGPSPARLTIPSAVENVFAREEGEAATRLRWQANPETGITGYVVYRHESRWDKDPITRLTPEPIAQTEWFDEAAGTGTRRFEVVAVDALGQEGAPSQPIWSRREWWRFYVPYVDEWRQ